MAWVSIRVKEGRAQGAGPQGRDGRAAPRPPPLERTHPSTFRIVDEVRSIRFNQEQEEELLQRCLSWNMSLESKSSVDIREMTREQDLITALVNRKKVQLLSFPLLPNQCSPPTSPSPATTPLVKVSDSVKVWPSPLGSQAPQQSPPIWLDFSFSGSPCPSCGAPHTKPSWSSAPSSFFLRGLEQLSSCSVADA